MMTIEKDFQNFQIYRSALPEDFKKKMLYYAASHQACTYLTNNNIDYPYEPFEELLAIGINKEIPFKVDTFQELQQF
ncbi:MAG: hypothetical protein ACPGJS_09675, partial [Flammeovirgaceae bacterium]